MHINRIVKCTALTLLFSTGALAVPDTFLYVGDLDENGAPADGNFSVTFQMFDDEAAGTVVYAETVASLVVVDGVLIHELGADPSNALDDAELAAGDLYLSVIVNGTTLEPRVAIRSVPFAAKAGDAESVGGVGLAALQSGSALQDGAIQERHFNGLTPIYEINIACGLFDLTASSFCLAPTDDCPSGEQHPCDRLFMGTNCSPITSGSRNCSNRLLGSLVFAP
jgi:hypothetical protein